MDINEIKKRIMERIQKDKSGSSGSASAAALAILSSRMGGEAKGALPEPDAPTPPQAAADNTTEGPEANFDSVPSKEKGPEKLLKEYRGKLAESDAENERLKVLYNDTLKQCEEALSQLREKDRTISDMEKRIEEGRERLNKRDAAEGDGGLFKLKKGPEYAALERSLEEHKKRTADLEAENARLKELHQSAAKERDDLSIRVKEKTKAAGYVEAMRSKLYAAEKELKDRNDRIDQLEEALRARDRKLADAERLYKNLDIGRNEIAVKLRDSDEERKNLEGEIARLNLEIETRDKRLADNERAFRKDLELSKNELSLELQSIERSKKGVEGKIAQLRLEIEAKNRRLEEYETACSELDGLVKESAMKVKTAEIEKMELENQIARLNSEIEAAAKRHESGKISVQKDIDNLKDEIGALKDTLKEKELKESEFNDMVAYFNSEIEERDKKIEMDARYCEKIVKEINELRHKAKI